MWCEKQQTKLWKYSSASSFLCTFNWIDASNSISRIAVKSMLRMKVICLHDDDDLCAFKIKSWANDHTSAFEQIEFFVFWQLILKWEPRATQYDKQTNSRSDNALNVQVECFSKWENSNGKKRNRWKFQFPLVHRTIKQRFGPILFFSIEWSTNEIPSTALFVLTAFDRHFPITWTICDFIKWSRNYTFLEEFVRFAGSTFKATTDKCALYNRWLDQISWKPRTR